jgi:hypothetical protein
VAQVQKAAAAATNSTAEQQPESHRVQECGWERERWRWRDMLVVDKVDRNMKRKYSIFIVDKVGLGLGIGEIWRKSTDKRKTILSVLTSSIHAPSLFSAGLL